MLPAKLLLLAAATAVAASEHEKRSYPYSNQVVLDDSKTVVAFPTSEDWWTIGSVNVVEWWWAPTYAPNLQVVLANPNPELLSWGLVLSENVEARLLSIRVTGISASAGSGYYIALLDRANTSHIYATSESFEIRPNGSTPVINPLPYGPLAKESVSSSATRVPLGAAAVMCALLALVL